MSKSATQTTLTADDMSDDEVPMLIEFDADSEGKPEPEQVKNDSKSDTEIETETETAAAPRTSTNASSPAAAAAASSKFTAAAAGDDAIPLTIVTGWLGSGKTTLVRHILDQFQQMNKTIAIIQNEFSDLGVEDALKLQDDSGAFSEMMELSNGSDFVVALEALMAKRRFDYILVECSGVADPGPLARLFWVDEELESPIYLDGIVSLVDGKHLLGNVRESRSESEQVIHQIAYADRIILNKIDLLGVGGGELKDNNSNTTNDNDNDNDNDNNNKSDTDSSGDGPSASSSSSSTTVLNMRQKVDLTSPALSPLVRELRKINAVAPILPTMHSQTPISNILNIKAFDETTNACSMLDIGANDDNENENENENENDNENAHAHTHTHTHDDDDDTTDCSQCKVDMLPLSATSSSSSSSSSSPSSSSASPSVAEHPHDLTITTCVLEHKGSEREGLTINRLNRWLAAVLWGEDEDLIEYADVSLDAKAPSQSAAAATASSTGPQKESDRPSTSDAPSNNDDGSTSAGDNKEGQKDPHKQEIFRLKGVLNVVGCENKYFLQGVQQLFDTFESNDAWSTCEQEKGGERVTRIVVIGRNLDKADLQRGMLRCMRDSQ